jgi:hypothetical protein
LLELQRIVAAGRLAGIRNQLRRSPNRLSGLPPEPNRPKTRGLNTETSVLELSLLEDDETKRRRECGSRMARSRSNLATPT